MHNAAIRAKLLKVAICLKTYYFILDKQDMSVLTSKHRLVEREKGTGLFLMHLQKEWCCTAGVTGCNVIYRKLNPFNPWLLSVHKQVCCKHSHLAMSEATGIY